MKTSWYVILRYSEHMSAFSPARDLHQQMDIKTPVVSCTQYNQQIKSCEPVPFDAIEFCSPTHVAPPATPEAFQGRNQTQKRQPAMCNLQGNNMLRTNIGQSGVKF